MELPSRSGSVARRQNSAAEQARTRLTSGLREWSGERSALTADELGRDPLRRVPRGWPEATLTRLEAKAREADVIDDERARSEASRLLWSAVSKLAGAAVALSIPVSILIALAAWL